MGEGGVGQEELIEEGGGEGVAAIVGEQIDLREECRSAGGNQLVQISWWRSAGGNQLVEINCWR